MLKERTEHEKELAAKELEAVEAHTSGSDEMTFAGLLAAEDQVAATIEAAPTKQVESDKKPLFHTEELLMNEFDRVTHELGLVYDKTW